MKLLYFNEEKFNEKYNKYYKLIYRTSYQYLFNKEASEDVTQEVFVKLLTKSPIFNDTEHEKAWLLRVAINLCKNKLKSKSNSDVTLFEYINNACNSFEEDINQQIDIINELKKLTPNQRISIYLYYYEGYSIKEIAKITKSNENTVKSHLSRAKQNIKLNIEKEILWIILIILTQ